MDKYKEADLFITINHEQRSVPKSLLITLLADIRMSSDDPKTLLSAIASSTIKALNLDNTGPLFRRFVSPGINQSLTVSEAVNGLNRSGLLGKVVHNSIILGPLADSTNLKTVQRAKKILNGYFDHVRNANVKRWEIGKSAFICVNPGIRAHLMLIGEIIKYLEHKKNIDFVEIDEEIFIKYLVDMGKPVFKFISEAEDEVIAENFSRMYGEGGVIEYLFNLCALVNKEYNDFGSDDFFKYLESITDSRVSDADFMVINLTQLITDYVIDVLKKVYGTHSMPSGDHAYWELGIQSKAAKERAYKKQQEDPPGEKRLLREAYIDILDLKGIIEQKNNWMHFEPVFNLQMVDEKSGKKYYTSWMTKFNEIRRIPAHKSKLRIYSEEDFEFLDWLNSEINRRMEKD